MTRIEKLRKIVGDHQYAKIDGVLVDVLTAASIIACYEKGSDRTKYLIQNARIESVASLALRMVKK